MCFLERNLNPKQACLKRREEEKGEIPSSMSSSNVGGDPLTGMGYIMSSCPLVVVYVGQLFTNINIVLMN